VGVWDFLTEPVTVRQQLSIGRGNATLLTFFSLARIDEFSDLSVDIPDRFEDVGQSYGGGIRLFRNTLMESGGHLVASDPENDIHKAYKQE
jgi:hypothetical protein